MGWCRLKLAGVEHCGLCGIAHLGHSRTCPHLTDETQVGRLLQTLKESPEPREHVEAATKYLRQIRGDLLHRKRKKMEQELNRSMQQAAQVRSDQQNHHQQQPNGYQQTGGIVEGVRVMSDSVRAATDALQGNQQ